MKKIVFPLITALLVSFTFSSCKKDGQKSMTDYLTRAGWKRTNLELGTGGVFTTASDWITEPPCYKDNILTFKSDKTWKETEGASKCFSFDDDIYDSGTWAFTADEKMLILNGESATIDKLDDNMLIVFIDFGGSVYRTTFTH